MPSNDIITQPHGPIDAIAVTVAFSADDLYPMVGCPACCSGMDPLLRDELRNAAV